jgi:hypothetical protein
MQTLRVVKEPHGWAVRLDPGMCTPFWSRRLAIQAAQRLCQSLRVHGVEVEVSIEQEPGPAPEGAGERTFRQEWPSQSAWL